MTKSEVVRDVLMRTGLADPRRIDRMNEVLEDAAALRARQTHEADAAALVREAREELERRHT
jgi:hypothetical protein